MEGKFKEQNFSEEQNLGLGGMGMPPPQQADSVGIIREMSPLKILDDCRNNLRGFYRDGKGGYVKRKGFVPLLNDYGINHVIHILGSVLNDVVTMSNLSPDKIGGYVTHLCDSVFPVMYIDYKMWGIKSKSDLDILANDIFFKALGALSKASGAGDRSLIRGAVSENIVQRPGIPTQEQKKHWYHKLSPFIK